MSAARRLRRKQGKTPPPPPPSTLRDGRPKSAPPEFLGRATRPKAPPVSRSWCVPPRNRTHSNILQKVRDLLVYLSKKLDFPFNRRNASGLAVWRQRGSTKSEEEGALQPSTSHGSEVEVTLLHFSMLISLGLCFLLSILMICSSSSPGPRGNDLLKRTLNMVGAAAQHLQFISVKPERASLSSNSQSSQQWTAQLSSTVIITTQSHPKHLLESRSCHEPQTLNPGCPPQHYDVGFSGCKKSVQL